MVSRAGVEPATCRLGGGCSIQLSYRDTGAFIWAMLFIALLELCLIKNGIQLITDQVTTPAVQPVDLTGLHQPGQFSFARD